MLALRAWAQPAEGGRGVRLSPWLYRGRRVPDGNLVQCRRALPNAKHSGEKPQAERRSVRARRAKSAPEEDAQCLYTPPHSWRLTLPLPLNACADMPDTLAGGGCRSWWGCRVACTRKAMSELARPNHTGVSSCLGTRCLSDLLPVAPERRYCPEDRNESTGCFPIACTCTVPLGRPASPARACPPDGLVPDPQTHGDPQSRPPTASDKSTPEPHRHRPTLCVPGPATHKCGHHRPQDKSLLVTHALRYH